MSYSTMYPNTLLCLKFVLCAIVVELAVNVPRGAHAAKPLPSPFAGHYGCQTYLDVTISDAGRIRGKLATNIDIAGSIAETGVIVGTLYFHRVRNAPGLTFQGKMAVIGMGALDENGNLFGVLQTEFGDVLEFVRPRCE